MTDRRRTQWIAENIEAINAYNEDVRKHGVFSDGRLPIFELEQTTMSKSKDTKRESKKEPKLSLKEKRAAKQAKKAGR